MTRVLVASDGPFPATALRHAGVCAGHDGEVVLAAVVVVPHALPLEAAPEGAVATACAMLDAGERLAPVAALDTRVVRARSFSEGVLGLLADEPFDALVLEVAGPVRNGGRAQLEVLMERARPECVLVRAARPGGDGLSP